MARLVACAAALGLGLLLAGPAAAQGVSPARGAVLRGLDKIAGTTVDLEIRAGQTVSWGDMSVTLSECRYPTEDPTSNAFAHLTVAADGGTVLFDGWMIADSPALSAMDHHRYDIWVIRCSTD